MPNQKNFQKAFFIKKIQKRASISIFLIFLQYCLDYSTVKQFILRKEIFIIWQFPKFLLTLHTQNSSSFANGLRHVATGSGPVAISLCPVATGSDLCCNQFCQCNWYGGVMVAIGLPLVAIGRVCEFGIHNVCVFFFKKRRRTTYHFIKMKRVVKNTTHIPTLSTLHSCRINKCEPPLNLLGSYQRRCYRHSVYSVWTYFLQSLAYVMVTIHQTFHYQDIV